LKDDFFNGRLRSDQMLPLEGIAIAPGYAAGVAVVYDDEPDHRLEFPDRDILPAEIGVEHERLDDAMEQSHRELEVAEPARSAPEAPTDSPAVLAAHAQLVHDIAAQVKQYLSHELVNVEQALDSVIGKLVDRLCRLEDVYLRQREQDIRDVGRQMMRHLTGTPRFPFSHLPEQAVIVARELLPSEAVELSRAGLAAIVTEQGGRDSHTAILARSLGIPFVTGLRAVTSQIQSGMQCLVDGEAGRMTIAPSAAEFAEFSKSREDYQRTTLTQYMLATDRRAADVTGDCTAWHPAVLRAIKRVVDAAGTGCPVCVCGEEAGEPDFARLLIGLGVRELSMTPVRAAPVRQALRKLDGSTARELASQALRCATPGEVRKLFADQPD
jgi:phosphoenolpyruvate-protein kinase (PTS system EI component)